FRSLADIGRAAGCAGRANRAAAEVVTKYIITDMYAKAVQGMPAEAAAKWAHDELVPGHLYELTYRARDPYVVAAGLAGIRDLLSFLRDHSFEGAPAPARTLIFGISQSGRVIQTMLLRGMHVDAAGRPVFDSAFIHVAGAGKG